MFRGSDVEASGSLGTRQVHLYRREDRFDAGLDSQLLRVGGPPPTLVAPGDSISRPKAAWKPQ